MKTNRSVFMAFAILLVTDTRLTAGDRMDPVQIWNTVAASQRFDYGLEAMVEVENRMGTDTPDWRRNSVSPQLIWHYSPRYDVSIGYENSREWMEEMMEDPMGMKRVDIVEREENTGYWTGTVHWKSNLFHLSSRQRFDFGSSENETLGIFRHQAKLTLNAVKLPFNLSPYVMNEFYYDLLGNKNLYKNMAQAGLEYKINRSFSIDVFAMRMDEWDQESNVITTPVVGLNLNINF